MTILNLNYFRLNVPLIVTVSSSRPQVNGSSRCNVDISCIYYLISLMYLHVSTIETSKNNTRVKGSFFNGISVFQLQMW